MTVVVLDTPEKIAAFQKQVLIRALAVYLRTNGRVQMNRTATPANMRHLASMFTGVHYPRGRKGLSQAYLDLTAP